jgi:hypothetical protein
LGVKVKGAHLVVMSQRVVLSELISQVGSALLPMDTEVALADTVADPVKAHINCAGSVLFDGVIGDAVGHNIVSLHGSHWLRIAHFSKGIADWACFLAVVEEGVYIGLGGRSEDIAHNIGDNVEHALECWIGVLSRIGAYEKEATSAGSGVSLGHVGGITVIVENHVTGMVSDECIGMGGDGVVEQMCGGFGGGVCSCGLGSSECAKGNKHGTVNDASIVEQDANNFLQAHDFGFGE